MDRRFSEFKLVGEGSYGVVVSANDSVLRKRVAIKKISPMAKHLDDAKHVLREIRLMRYMGKHENIVTLEDLAIRETADELYIVMELLDSDLHRVLQSKQILTENHLKYFFFQLICGVKFLHDHRIIHRDLKPGNLLVNKDCKLRIADFGLAREMPSSVGLSAVDTSEDVERAPMTEHVITRWYRPPELMLLPDGLYSFAVDMWSCGCILGEMLGRSPMFPGKNFIHQLTLIFDVIGGPSRAEVRHILNPQAVKYLETQFPKKRVPINNIYPRASKEAIDTIESLLVFNPESRATATEVLYDFQYLSTLAKTSGSASLIWPEVGERFEFSFETSKATKYQLKALISVEVNDFHCEKYGKPKSRSMSQPRGQSINPELSSSDTAKASEVKSQSTDKPRSASAQRPSSSHVTDINKEPTVPGRPIQLSSTATHGRRQSLTASPSSKKAVEGKPPIIQSKMSTVKSVTAANLKKSSSTTSSAKQITAKEPLPVPPRPIDEPLPVKAQICATVAPTGDDDNIENDWLTALYQRAGLLPTPGVELKKDQNALMRSSVESQASGDSNSKASIKAGKTSVKGDAIERVTDKLKQSLRVSDDRSLNRSHDLVSIPLPPNPADPFTSSIIAEIIPVSRPPTASAVPHSEMIKDLENDTPVPRPPIITNIHKGHYNWQSGKQDPTFEESKFGGLESDSRWVRNEDNNSKIGNIAEEKRGDSDNEQKYKYSLDIAKSGPSNGRARHRYQYEDEDDDPLGYEMYAKYGDDEINANSQAREYGSIPNTSLDKTEPLNYKTHLIEPSGVDENGNTQQFKKQQGLKKKKLTVAKSPKFSKMSWERKAEAMALVGSGQVGEPIIGVKRIGRQHENDIETIFSNNTGTESELYGGRSRQGSTSRGRALTTEKRSTSAQRFR